MILVRILFLIRITNPVLDRNHESCARYESCSRYESSSWYEILFLVRILLLIRIFFNDHALSFTRLDGRRRLCSHKTFSGLLRSEQQNVHSVTALCLRHCDNCFPRHFVAAVDEKEECRQADEKCRATEHP